MKTSTALFCDFIFMIIVWNVAALWGEGKGAYVFWPSCSEYMYNFFIIWMIMGIAKVCLFFRSGPASVALALPISLFFIGWNIEDSFGWACLYWLIAFIFVGGPMLNVHYAINSEID